MNYCDANCEKPHADETVDDGYAESSPVRSYPEGVSWVGALDMAGNVGEWVADWLGDYPSVAQTNPTGPATGRDKVLRGSSWVSFQDRSRTATRDKLAPAVRFNRAGFRCVGPPGD